MTGSQEKHTVLSMQPPRELKPEDFTERLSPIFVHIAKESGLPFDVPHIVARWREWMKMGFARTWEIPGAVLGALFTHDLFTNRLRAMVVFWFSLPEVRHSAATGSLFKAFEAAARTAGCVDIQSAAHQLVDPLRREHGYLKHGFQLTETVFTKTL